MDPVSRTMTFGLLLNFLAAYLFSWWFRRKRWQPEFSKMYVQFLLLPLLLVIGALADRFPEWAAFDVRNFATYAVLIAFLVASLTIGGYFVHRMKGLRWFATSAFLLQIWMLHGVAAIAGMAISGDWI
jgi:hypothetical protein